MKNYYSLKKKKSGIKYLQFLIYFFLFITSSIQNTLLAQTIKPIVSPKNISNKLYSLSDLATHDFNQSNRPDIIDWKVFYNKNRDGDDIFTKGYYESSQMNNSHEKLNTNQYEKKLFLLIKSAG